MAQTGICCWTHRCCLFHWYFVFSKENCFFPPILIQLNPGAAYAKFQKEEASTSLEWIKKAAEQKNQRALILLGTSRMEKKILNLFCFCLHTGRWYSKGTFVEKSPELCFRYMKAASELNQKEGWNELGNFLVQIELMD